MSLEKKILEVVREKGEVALSDLYAALPEYPRHSVRSKASVLAKRGVLRKVRKGVYALPDRNKTPAEEPKWAENILEAIRQGCTTYSSLCARFGAEKGHIIRSVVSRLKKRGEIVSPKKGHYQVAPRQGEEPLRDIANMQLHELALLADMVPEGKIPLRGQLRDAAAELSSRGLVRVENNNLILTPLGVHVAAFVRSYRNLRRRVREPSEEDVQAELFRLSFLLEEVSSRRKEILSTVNNLLYAAESISSSANRLVSIARRRA